MLKMLQEKQLPKRVRWTMQVHTQSINNGRLSLVLVELVGVPGVLLNVIVVPRDPSLMRHTATSKA